MRAKDNEAAARIRTQGDAADWTMQGKTVLFTGASRGMGRLAALELARLGAEVLVVGHDQARGAAAVEAIRGTGVRRGSCARTWARPPTSARWRQPCWPAAAGSTC